MDDEDDDDFNDYHLHPDDMLFEIDDAQNVAKNAGPKPKPKHRGHPRRKLHYMKNLMEDDSDYYYEDEDDDSDLSDEGDFVYDDDSEYTDGYYDEETDSDFDD